MGGSLNSLTVWVALDDVPYEMGPLEVLPGSHRALYPTTLMAGGFHAVDDGDLPSRNWVCVPLNHGDAVVFSSFLVHRSGMNRHPTEPRVSLQWRFSDMNCRWWRSQNFRLLYEHVQTPGGVTPTPEELGEVWCD